MSLAGAKFLYLLHDDTGIAGIYTSKALAKEAVEPGDVISVVPVGLVDKPLGVKVFTPPSAALITYGEFDEHDTLAASMAKEALSNKAVVEYALEAITSGKTLIQDCHDAVYPPYPEHEEDIDYAPVYEPLPGGGAPPTTSFISADIDLG